MNDLIYKSAVLNILNAGAELLRCTLERVDIIGAERVKYEFGLGLIEACIADAKELPPAQPDLDEWCTDCREYDKDRHSCPRWNRVIRQTVEDMKAAQPELD